MSRRYPLDLRPGQFGPLDSPAMNPYDGAGVEKETHGRPAPRSTQRRDHPVLRELVVLLLLSPAGMAGRGARGCEDVGAPRSAMSADAEGNNLCVFVCPEHRPRSGDRMELPGTARGAATMTDLTSPNGNHGSHGDNGHRTERVESAKPYRLAGRLDADQRTVVRIGDVEVGGGQPVTIAGPCAVESREQLLEAARAVR